MQVISPRYSRRHFLRALGQGALLAGAPRLLLADQPELVTISVLHTTDLHGHILPTTDYAGRPDLGGLARCATQIRQWLGENANAAVIDIGDIYQGTEEGLSTHGMIMVRLLNSLGYDGWVVGNHDFDWGMDVLRGAMHASAMPVLSANSALATGESVVRPYFIKELAGFRLAFVGLTTPGLGSWIPAENRQGFDVLDPIETLRRIMPEIAAQHPDAVIVAGHMGLKRQDDFANRIGALTQEFPQLTACIGGHTHQDRPGEIINNVLYTQSDHFGIHAGKLDLTFDQRTRRLVRREATTVEMNHAVALDPLVLHLAQSVLDDSARVLSQPIGALTEPFGASSSFGAPCDLERLIGSAMRDALRKRGVEVDAVVHGLFEGVKPWSSGPKTIADAWQLLPYENQIVTLDLTRAGLLAFAPRPRRKARCAECDGAQTCSRFGVRRR